ARGEFRLRFQVQVPCLWGSQVNRTKALFAQAARDGLKKTETSGETISVGRGCKRPGPPSARREVVEVLGFDKGRPRLRFERNDKPNPGGKVPPPEALRTGN